MKKFLARLLLFIIFIPMLILIIFKFNFWNFLLLNILYIVFTFLGALETRNFFASKKQGPSSWILPAISTLFPIMAYLMQRLGTGFMFQEMLLVSLLIFLLVKSSFFDTGEDFSKLYPNLTADVLVLLYPGLFVSYLIRIQQFDSPHLLTALLIGLVFGNDIFAYIGGRLLGGKTKMNLKISPNKSLVGFLSGIVFSVGFILLFYFLAPQLFNVHVVFVILFGILLAFATIFGDLMESALKRASGLKDSGKLMLGRGGVLDSIDSLLLCAPFFYFVYPLLAGN